MGRVVGHLRDCPVAEGGWSLIGDNLDRNKPVGNPVVVGAGVGGRSVELERR